MSAEHPAASTEIAVGQVWRSLDPRDMQRKRTVEILDYDAEFVFVVSYLGYRRGRRSRIHRSRFDGVQYKRVLSHV